MTDDRATFAAEQLANARRMAADGALARKALDVTAHADRYDYSYYWTWLGVPIIQMPPDIVALQEVVWRTRPQLVVETGVARGGSVVFFASLLELLGEGTVVGVDIDIRPHNRRSIEDHPLARRIRLIEGSSTDSGVADAVHSMAGEAERVMVVLDSHHSHDHVLAELRAYGPTVTQGCYLVVADTFIESLPSQEHRPRPWGPGDNPATAVRAYLAETDRFEVDSDLDAKLLMTSNPGGYLRCVRG